MAGGNFMNRVISYVVNEIIIDGLANNWTFQRFAVRTSMEEIQNLAKKKREKVVAQVKQSFEVG